jgi:WD40 repeat protein
MNICLSEIKRCQQVTPRPNFVILLGERYGWCPPPPQIPADEFRAVYKKSSKEGQEIIAQWYRCDHNAVPPEYILQPWDEYNYEEWGQIERKLHDALLSGARAAGLDQDAMFKYWASATHQEIAAGALSENAEPENVFAFIRKISRLPDDEAARDYLDCNPEGNPDTEAQTYLNALKSTLDEVLADNVKRYETDWISNKPQVNYIDQLCDDMVKSLKGVIEDQLSELEEVDPLEREVSEHKSFGEERAHSFVGRQTVFEKIDTYLSDQNYHPLAIWGESGSGKSALLGKAVANAEDENQDTEIIYRFIGATPESSNGRSLLDSLCRQISRLYGAEESDIPIEFKDLVQDFPERLSLATEDKPLIIFIDALDQLGELDNAKALSWIPAELPEHVRLVVSTLPGTCLDALKTKLPDSYLVELQPLSSDLGNDLLDIWLGEAGRKLQPEQRKELMNKFNTNRLPLYLKLAFEEARRWKSYSPLCKIKPDIPGVIQDMFDRLSRDTNHGKVLFSHALGYLAAAKNGLSEDEILDVLSENDDVMTDFFRRSPESPSVERLPIVVWSRLYADLEPYLSQRSADGTSLMSFYHPTTFGKAVRETYLREDVKIERHRALASNFEQQPLSRGEDDEKEFNLRKLSELPFQQTYGHLWDELKSLLTDFEFLYAKVSAVGPQPLIEDYNEANIAGYRGQDLSQMQKALEISAHVLNEDENLLWSQLHGRLMNTNQPEIQSMLSKMPIGSWLRPLKQILAPVSGPLVRTLSGHSSYVTSVKLTDDGKYAISTSRHIKTRELKVWDIQTGKNIHSKDFSASVLEYHKDRNKILYSVGSSIKILDLETGNLITNYQRDKTVKGTVKAISPDGKLAISVMQNKKLELWDIETGKTLQFLDGHKDVPDDIAISPNGKWAVSTNRYYQSIKVWNLISGKEHIAIKASRKEGEIVAGESIVITPDGERVISLHASKTLCVWDLKSGEILQILRGRTNAVRLLDLAISQDGRWVLSTTRYAIDVWDLDKGEKIGSLDEHTGFVNAVSVNKDGQIAVSASSDKTVKVWNLEALRGLKTEEKGSENHSSHVMMPNGRNALSTFSNKLVVWKLETGEKINEFKIGKGPNWSVRGVTPSANFAIIVRGYNFFVLDLRTGNIIQQGIRAHDRSIKKLKLSPCGRYLFTSVGKDVGSDRHIKIWDLSNNDIKKLNELVGEKPISNVHGVKRLGDDKIYLEPVHILKNTKTRSKVYSFDVSPDGKFLVSSSSDGAVRVWDLESCEICRIFQGHTEDNNLTGVAISPDGRCIISGYKKRNIIKVWDINTGQRLYSLEENKSVCFTPDGEGLIVISVENDIKLLELRSGRVINYFEKPTVPVYKILISPDGDRVFSKSGLSSIQVWDMKSGKVMTTFQADKIIGNLQLGVNGRTILFSEKRGPVRFLRLENVFPESPFVTAQDYHIHCPFCQKMFEIKPTDLGSEVSCLYCHKKLRINKFNLEMFEPLSKLALKNPKIQKSKPKESFSPKNVKQESTKSNKTRHLSRQVKKPNLKKPSSKERGKRLNNLTKKNKTSKPSNMFDINKPKPPAGSIIESMKKSKGKPKKMSFEESMRHAMKHQKKKKSKKKSTPKKKTKDKNDSEDDKNED